MTKIHCDVCERLINSGELLFDFKNQTGFSGFSAYVYARGGRDMEITYDICQYCLVDKLKKADDRPKTTQ